ncbi:MAG: threonine/serine exporter family protein [Clostridium perfringens]|nr:threonine/serine exporter family protein [Clostridium perfringens]
MRFIFEVIASFFATIGFGILFNIKGKNLIFAGIGGGISWFMYEGGILLGFSVVASMFVSALVFSTYSEICARILKTPVTTIVVCALIPLVPGGGMYYTMYEAIHGNAVATWDKASSTLLSAGALALGVIFVSSVTKLILKPRRKALDNSTVNLDNNLDEIIITTKNNNTSSTTIIGEEAVSMEKDQD